MTKICSLKTTLEKSNFKYWKNLGNVETEESNTGGQNNYFETLALSKITFLAQVLVIPNQIIDALEQIQKYLWNLSSPKVKHETICKDCQYGRLTNVDIKSNIISLQCSWFKKLYDESFHEWKLIPLTLIKNTFGECFIFHSNLDFNVSLNSFPEFCINIFHSWKSTFTFLSLAPSCFRS